MKSTGMPFKPEVGVHRVLRFNSRMPFLRTSKYKSVACKNKEVQPGRILVFEKGQLTNPRYIINFPTKRHWKGKTRIDDIDARLKALVNTIRQYNIRSIAIPPLGSRLGGLDWLDVKPHIKAALQPLTDVRVIIFEPHGAAAAEKMVHNRDVPA